MSITYCKIIFVRSDLGVIATRFWRVQPSVNLTLKCVDPLDLLKLKSVFQVFNQTIVSIYLKFKNFNPKKL